jgi:hypothetical protein
VERSWIVSKVTLAEEIADIKRELALRVRKYPEWRARETDPRKIAEMRAEHEHQIACTRATLARLEALIPKQASLFL